MVIGIAADFLAGWSEGQIAGLSSVSRSMFGAAVRGGLEAGFSGNQMLNALTSRGLGIRRQNFQAIVRNVKSSMASSADAAAYDLNSVPTMGKVQEIEFGNMTGYYHKVDVTFSQVEDGERMEFTTKIIVRTNEHISVSEATLRAKETFDKMASSDKYEPRTFLYSEYAGVVHQVARKSA